MKFVIQQSDVEVNEAVTRHASIKLDRHVGAADNFTVGRVGWQIKHIFSATNTIKIYNQSIPVGGFTTLQLKLSPIESERIWGSTKRCILKQFMSKFYTITAN